MRGSVSERAAKYARSSTLRNAVRTQGIRYVFRKEGADTMLRRAATIVVVVASAIWVAPAPVLAVDPTDWIPVFSESFDDPGALPPACAAYDGVSDGTSDGVTDGTAGGVSASYFRPE